MACPVCLGAFSWRQDLLHHFGAVHHLEELIACLDSEFTCESCPPCCRVPRYLFKDHLPEPVNSVSTSVRAGDKRHVGTTECLNTGFPIGKIEQSDDTQAEGSGGANTLDSRSFDESSNAGVKSIERYHCDICEFSANDMQQLLEHSSEHAAEKTLSPEPEQVSEEPQRLEHFSDVSDSTQVQKDRHFCDRCPFSTKYRHLLLMHTACHTRSASVKVGYRCGYCDIASPYSSSIKSHLKSSHRGQHVKILQFARDKVLDDCPSKTVTDSMSYTGAIKKRRKLKKLSKSKFVAIKRNLCSSQKSSTNIQAESLSSVNTQVLNDVIEVASEKLESQSPDQVSEEPPSLEHFSNVSDRTQVHEERYFCDNCPFSTKYQQSLKQHANTHMRSSLVRVGYKCGYCNVASPYRSTISAHLVRSHSSQPVKVLQFAGSKMINVHDFHSESAKSGVSYADAMTTLRKNLYSSQQPLTSDQAQSSMNTHVLNGDIKISAEMLESQLPAQMIYRKPVQCPACNFENHARVNLVRHIRLVHAERQHSQPTSSVKSFSSSFIRANYGNMDPDRLTSAPLQV